MTKHELRCLLKEKDNGLKPSKRVIDFIVNYSKSIDFVNNESFDKIKINKN